MSDSRKDNDHFLLFFAGIFACCAIAVEALTRFRCGSKYFFPVGIATLVMMFGFYFVGLDTLGFKEHENGDAIYSAFGYTVAVALLFQLCTMKLGAHSQFYGRGVFDGLGIAMGRLVEAFATAAVAYYCVFFCSVKLGLFLSAACIGILIRAAITAYQSHKLDQANLDARGEQDKHRQSLARLEKKHTQQPKSQTTTIELPNTRLIAPKTEHFGGEAVVTIANDRKVVINPPTDQDNLLEAGSKTLELEYR